jgi:hypothetical protein
LTRAYTTVIPSGIEESRRSGALDSSTSSE